METLYELKAIRDNSPDGATLYDGEYFKFECDDYHRWASICDMQDWYVDIEPSCDVRSLSDIKRIIEQREMLEIAWSAIQEAGYEDFCSELRNYIEGE